MDGLAVGRVVHFALDAALACLENGNPFPAVVGDHRAAVVVGVVDPRRGVVNVQVLHNSPHVSYRHDVRYSEKQEPGTWHWPERA